MLAPLAAQTAHGTHDPVSRHSRPRPRAGDRPLEPRFLRRPGSGRRPARPGHTRDGSHAASTHRRVLTRLMLLAYPAKLTARRRSPGRGAVARGQATAANDREGPSEAWTPYPDDWAGLHGLEHLHGPRHPHLPVNHLVVVTEIRKHRDSVVTQRIEVLHQPDAVTEDGKVPALEVC